MKIDDYLSERTGGNYGPVHNNPLWQEASETGQQIESIITDRLPEEGTKLVEQLQRNKVIYQQLTELHGYLRGFSDGLTLGKLLQEYDTD